MCCCYEVCLLNDSSLFLPLHFTAALPQSENMPGTPQRRSGSWKLFLLSNVHLSVNCCRVFNGNVRFDAIKVLKMRSGFRSSLMWCKWADVSCARPASVALIFTWNDQICLSSPWGQKFGVRTLSLLSRTVLLNCCTGTRLERIERVLPAPLWLMWKWTVPNPVCVPYVWLTGLDSGLSHRLVLWVFQDFRASSLLSPSYANTQFGCFPPCFFVCVRVCVCLLVYSCCVNSAELWTSTSALCVVTDVRSCQCERPPVGVGRPSAFPLRLSKSLSFITRSGNSKGNHWSSSPCLRFAVIPWNFLEPRLLPPLLLGVTAFNTLLHH